MPSYLSLSEATSSRCVQHSVTHRGQRAVKRILDVLLAAVALAVLSPLMLLIAAVIKLSSRGPVFYRWPVVGEHGRTLKAYKFRTMVVEADRMKESLMRFNEAAGPVFKMKRDPRVTSVGRLLRTFSLDELPQLWSVLKGDMSLVGPRPVLLTEWAQFNEFQKQKLSTKPGGVCLWHVTGQPRDLDEWVKLDLEYIENSSLALDAKILIRAVWYILSGKNC